MSILETHPAAAPITITHELSIIGTQAESLWEAYRTTFEPLAELAVLQHLYSRDEVLAELANPRIIKIVGWQDGKPVGLAMVTNSLEDVPQISPAFLRSRYPDTRHATRSTSGSSSWWHLDSVAARSSRGCPPSCGRCQPWQVACWCSTSVTSIARCSVRRSWPSGSPTTSPARRCRSSTARRGTWRSFQNRSLDIRPFLRLRWPHGRRCRPTSRVRARGCRRPCARRGRVG